MSQFYLTLPSNSSEEYFGRQKLAHFTTKLPHTLQLDADEWEVGLSEIIYPYSWKNLRKDCVVHIGVSNLQMDNDSGEYLVHEKQFKVQMSHYMSPNDLVEKLNKRIAVLIRRIKNELTKTEEEDGYTYFDNIKGKYLLVNFRYDENVGKVYLSGTNHTYVILPTPLSQMLGFGDSKAVLGSEALCPQIRKNICHQNEVTCHTFKYEDEQEDDFRIKLLKGEYIADVNRTCTALYVYSPIVQSQMVGDTQAPLLRVVSVKGNFGNIINERYDLIYYLPLARSNIDQIEVYIRDDVGEYIPFVSGRVVVILHFRRKI